MEAGCWLWGAAAENYSLSATLEISAVALLLVAASWFFLPIYQWQDSDQGCETPQLTMELQPRSGPIVVNDTRGPHRNLRGVGKTQVAIGIAHGAATGGAFLNWRAPVPRNVLYVDGEMPGADLQERLRMFSRVSSGRLEILPMDEQEIGDSLNLKQTESQERLEAILVPTELLILDNRSTLTSGGRENEAESWTRCNPGN
ncbi:AAA family ATPase [Mesorhizobium sp. M0320]